MSRQVVFRDYPHREVGERWFEDVQGTDFYGQPGTFREAFARTVCGQTRPTRQTTRNPALVYCPACKAAEPAASDA